MTDIEARLAALLAQDAPPARDLAFRLAVLERIERRRLGQRIAFVAGAGVAAGALLWLVSPQLAQASQAWPALLGGLGGTAALVWATLTLTSRSAAA